MYKRGQAAMEFLMTYGWAILVVLVVIGALAGFGILDPTRFVGERCTFETGLNCEDWLIDATGDTMSLALTNSLGKGIIITNLVIDDPDNSNNDLFDETNCLWDFAGAANCNGLTVSGGTCDWGGNAGFHLANGERGSMGPLACGGAGDEITDTIVGAGKEKAIVTITYYFDDSDAAFSKTAQAELLTAPQ